MQLEIGDFDESNYFNIVYKKQITETKIGNV